MRWRRGTPWPPLGLLQPRPPYQTDRGGGGGTVHPTHPRRTHDVPRAYPTLDGQKTTAPPVPPAAVGSGRRTLRRGWRRRRRRNIGRGRRLILQGERARGKKNTPHLRGRRRRVGGPSLSAPEGGKPDGGRKTTEKSGFHPPALSPPPAGLLLCPCAEKRRGGCRAQGRGNEIHVTCGRRWCSSVPSVYWKKNLDRMSIYARIWRGRGRRRKETPSPRDVLSPCPSEERAYVGNVREMGQRECWVPPPSAQASGKSEFSPLPDGLDRKSRTWNPSALFPILEASKERKKKCMCKPGIICCRCCWREEAETNGERIG